MISSSSIRRSLARHFPYSSRRDSLVFLCCLAQKLSDACLLTSTYSTESFSYAMCMQHSSYRVARHILEAPLGHSSLEHSLARRSKIFVSNSCFGKWATARCMSIAPFGLKTENDVRFSVGKRADTNCSSTKGKKMAKRVKMSRKAKLSELRLYRLKAKKKKNSPNPEVRIRYKLGKAKRKEAWLIEKLMKFEVPKASTEAYDPEILTEEEKHYLKRTGEKKKNYVQVGRRGVFGGVVLNMHMHWKNHETVKVICKPCKPGEVHEYAEELARLSKGIVIDLKPNNIIIFYRGKNYVQPKVMSPPDTLSKNKALEKYKYMQSLEHTSQFIEKLEKELEEYHKHLARFKKMRGDASRDDLVTKLHRKVASTNMEQRSTDEAAKIRKKRQQQETVSGRSR